MNTPRPTPETDAAWACFKGHTELLHDVKNLSRKLERERDEARKELSSIHRWIERNHADGFIDSLTYLQNLERVTDSWYDRIDAIETDARRFVRERDEAKELHKKSLCEREAAERESDATLERAHKAERERDEALSLITKTKAILQQVDLPDELLDVQAQRMVNQHDWQLGIARGQAKQIEQANRTVHTMREAIKEAHTELSNILDIINNSRGVDNWHLNGAVATWNEFDINPAVALTKLQPFIS
jgi:hypothetical protein